METKVVSVKKPEEVNLIFGQTHFIKSVEDIHEALVGAVPGIKFGLAFCEASGLRLIRTSGTSDEMITLARDNALAVGCGHTFFVFLENAYPINVLNALKMIPEITHIYCATSNPLQVIVATTHQGTGVLGVVDGSSPIGVEDQEDKVHRKELLRKLGYKL